MSAVGTAAMTPAPTAAFGVVATVAVFLIIGPKKHTPQKEGGRNQ